MNIKTLITYYRHSLTISENCQIHYKKRDIANNKLFETYYQKRIEDIHKDYTNTYYNNLKNKKQILFSSIKHLPTNFLSPILSENNEVMNKYIEIFCKLSFLGRFLPSSNNLKHKLDTLDNTIDNEQEEEYLIEYKQTLSFGKIHIKEDIYMAIYLIPKSTQQSEILKINTHISECVLNDKNDEVLDVDVLLNPQFIDRNIINGFDMVINFTLKPTINRLKYYLNLIYKSTNLDEQEYNYEFFTSYTQESYINKGIYKLINNIQKNKPNLLLQDFFTVNPSKYSKTQSKESIDFSKKNTSYFLEKDYIDSMHKHYGGFDTENALAPTQRLALYAEITNENSILSVNGAPGTGKTALLRALVSNKYINNTLSMINAYKEDKKITFHFPILSVSTNNKALYNITQGIEEGFKSIASQGGIYEPWLTMEKANGTSLQAKGIIAPLIKNSSYLSNEEVILKEDIVQLYSSLLSQVNLMTSGFIDKFNTSSKISPKKHNSIKENLFFIIIALSKKLLANINEIRSIDTSTQRLLEIYEQFEIEYKIKDTKIYPLYKVYRQEITDLFTSINKKQLDLNKNNNLIKNSINKKNSLNEEIQSIKTGKDKLALEYNEAQIKYSNDNFNKKKQKIDADYSKALLLYKEFNIQAVLKNIKQKYSKKLLEYEEYELLDECATKRLQLIEHRTNVFNNRLSLMKESHSFFQKIFKRKAIKQKIQKNEEDYNASLFEVDTLVKGFKQTLLNSYIIEYKEREQKEILKIHKSIKEEKELLSKKYQTNIINIANKKKNNSDKLKASLNHYMKTEETLNLSLNEFSNQLLQNAQELYQLQQTKETHEQIIKTNKASICNYFSNSYTLPQIEVLINRVKEIEIKKIETLIQSLKEENIKHDTKIRLNNFMYSIHIQEAFFLLKYQEKNSLNELEVTLPCPSCRNTTIAYVNENKYECSNCNALFINTASHNIVDGRGMSRKEIETFFETGSVKINNAYCEPVVNKKFINVKKNTSPPLSDFIKAIREVSFVMPLINVSANSYGNIFASSKGNIQKDLFELILIDEAGTISPTHILSLYAAKKAILFGDAQQLEPIYPYGRKTEQLLLNNFTHDVNIVDTHGVSTCSAIDIANRSGLIHFPDSQSRLNGDIWLMDHYRCREAIISISNELSYENEIIAHKPNVSGERHLTLVEHFSEFNKSNNTNTNEIYLILQYLKDMEKTWLEKYNFSSRKELCKELVILTPFKIQANNARSIIAQAYGDIECGTIHSMQGGEKTIAIFSTVYNYNTKKKAQSLFFNKNANMFNVAISRAKEEFILFGNKSVLSHKGTYSSLVMKHMLDNNNANHIFMHKTINNEYQKNLIESYDEHHAAFKEYSQMAKKSILIISPFLRKESFKIYETLKTINKNITVEVRFGFADDEEKAFDIANSLGNIEEKKLVIAYQYNKIDTLMSSYLDTQKIEQKIVYIVFYIMLLSKIAKIVFSPKEHRKIVLIDKNILLYGSYNWLSASRADCYAKVESSFIIKDDSMIGSLLKTL